MAKPKPKPKARKKTTAMEDLETATTEVTTDGQSLIDPQYRTVRAGPPTIDEIAAMQRYFLSQRDELIRRANEIEEMLGFVVTSADLATRLAKIELFLGVKA
jgi:hypothetical protein